MLTISKINIDKDNNTAQIRSDYCTMCTLSDTIMNMNNFEFLSF